MKGLKTRLGALALSAALVLTMTPSVLSNAEESGTQSESVEDISGTKNSDQVKEEPEGTEEKDSPESEQQPEKDEDEQQQEEQGENEKDSSEGSGTDGQGQDEDNKNDQPDGQEEDDQNNGQEEPGSDGTEGQAPSVNSIMLPEVQLYAAPQTRNADITKPVIESVEFDQNGQTLKAGDTLSFRVYATDADSGIKELRVELRYQTEENSYYQTHYIYGVYNESQRCYIAEEKLENVGTGKVTVVEAYAVDNMGNYAVYTCDDVWFETAAESDTASVKEISFDANGKTVNEDDFSNAVSGWVKLDKTLPDSTITLRFTGENNDEFEISYYWNETEGRYDSYSGAGYDYPWNSEAGIVKYVLSDIYVDRFGGHAQITMEGMENYYLNIEFNESGESTETRPQITSVDLDKNTQTVKVGDKITLTVKVDESEKMSKTGSAWFRPAEDIDVSNLYVELIYDETQKAYVGTITIEEGTYPCEWYLYDVEIYREDSMVNETELSDSFEGFYNTYPWYFNVYSEDTFVTSAKNLNIQFYRQYESGLWSYDSEASITKENVPRRFTLKELGVTLPEMSSAIDGVSQTGWTDQWGNPITEDTELLNDYGYISIYASYDKNMVRAQYQYLSTDGTIVDETRMIEMGADATYGEYYEKAESYVPTEMTREYGFTGWEYSRNSWLYEDSDPIESHFTGMLFRAKYDGKTVVRIEKHYYDSQGYSVYEMIPLILDEGATSDEVIDYVNAMDVPEVYPGIRFAGWSVPYLNAGETLENFQWVSVRDTYENCLIRYEIYEDEVGYDVEPDLLVCQVAEQGDTVTIPDSFGEFSNVEWEYMPAEGETFTARGSYMTFIGAGSRNGETVTQPETPENPDDPAKLSEETINSVVEQINSAAEGGNVIVDMGNATVVPKDILEAAKGKDIDVVLNMGGYTWTINGKDIYSSNLKDIDLRVTLDTDNIPSNIIQALAGDNPAKQLSLAHNGDFGFLATLTVNVGAENAGRFGNLYYYDSEGRLIFMNAGTVTSDGRVSLEFSHASEYVIVMSEQQMSQAEADVVNNDTLNSGKGTDEASDKAVDKVSAKASNQAAGNGAVKTGDTESGAASAAVLLVVSLAVIVAAGVAVRRRNVKR